MNKKDSDKEEISGSNFLNISSMNFLNCSGSLKIVKTYYNASKYLTIFLSFIAS